MKDIIADANRVAFCGLYCGSCRRYRKGGCPGCQGNEKASWCKIRSCCLENGYRSCVDCTVYDQVTECKYYTGITSRFFSLVFRSDRPACVKFISEKGYDKYAEHMAENKLMSLSK